MPCACSASRPSITTARPPSSRTAASSRRRRRSASRARSTMPAFPTNAIRYCLEAGNVDSRRRRPRRVLREAADQVRAAARDLSRQRAARLCRRSAWRCRCGSRRSCSRSRTWRRRSKALRAERQGRGQAAVRRAPPEPCGLRLLPLARSTRRSCSPWTASASGPRPRSRSAAATRWSRCARSTGRTASACSTRPSPTTPASRSTPASTR